MLEGAERRRRRQPAHAPAPAARSSRKACAPPRAAPPDAVPVPGARRLAIGSWFLPGPAAAQVTVNPGALDLLPAQPARPAGRVRAPPAPAARPARGRPARRPHRRPRPGRPARRRPPPRAHRAARHRRAAARRCPCRSPGSAAARRAGGRGRPGRSRRSATGVRVTFGPDRADLNPATEAALRALARSLKANETASVNVYRLRRRHADDPSTPRRLSLARALAARAVLITEGIASTRIYPRALGSTGGDAGADRVDVTAGPPGPPPPRPRCWRRPLAARSWLGSGSGAPSLAPPPGRRRCGEVGAMTRPNTYLIRMVVFLLAVLVVAALLNAALLTAFASNPLLNTLIGVVLLIGVGWNLVQVMRLGPEVHWLETFQKQRTQLAALPPPRLLAPMASMLSARQAKSRDGQDRFTLSAPAMRSVLDSLSSRLDESRELIALHDGAADLPGAARHVLGPAADGRLRVGRDQRHVGRLRRPERAVRAAEVRARPAAARAWARRSAPPCSAWPGRWCWASWTSRPGRRRTASSTSWRSGSPG